MQDSSDYIPITGDWFLGTDGMSFLLLKRRVVADAKHAKAHNIGKERYDTMGYYPSLGAVAAGLHRYVSIEVLINSGARTLEEYVEKVDEQISSIKRLDDMMVEKLKERMGV